MSWQTSIEYIIKWWISAVTGTVNHLVLAAKISVAKQCLVAEAPGCTTRSRNAWTGWMWASPGRAAVLGLQQIQLFCFWTQTRRICAQHRYWVESALAQRFLAICCFLIHTPQAKVNSIPLPWATEILILGSCIHVDVKVWAKILQIPVYNFIA